MKEKRRGRRAQPGGDEEAQFVGVVPEFVAREAGLRQRQRYAWLHRPGFLRTRYQCYPPGKVACTSIRTVFTYKHGTRLFSG